MAASEPDTERSGPEYILARDYLDDNRINLQHYLWTESDGYLIHPNIPKDDSRLRVADVGCGTGIWLTSLARQLPPTVQLDGLDISFDAAPPTEWLSANITLRKWDVTSDVPDDLVGVYDIVHIKLFMFVLKDDQVPVVLQNLHKLLKPNGYVQWDDADVSSLKIIKTSLDIDTSTSQELLALSQSQDSRLAPTWVPKLPELFATAGFKDIVSDTKDMPRDLAFMMHVCNMMVHESIVRTTKNKIVEEKLKKLIPSWTKETREGAMWTIVRYAVVGRKGE